MSYFARNENLVSLNEDVRSLFYNLLTRVLLGVPRKVYDKQKQLSLDSMKGILLGIGFSIANIPFLHVIVIAVIAGIVFTYFRENNIAEKLDQYLLNKYYDIKKIENKLIKMAGDKCKIDAKEADKMELKFGNKDEIGSYYKSKVKDTGFVSTISHNMAFHIAKRGKYVYIFIFDFDSNGIYNVYTPFIERGKYDSVIHMKRLDQFDKLDPSIYEN